MTLQRRASGELLMTASGALVDECCCGPIPPSGDCAWTLSPSSLVFSCTGQAGAFNVNVLTGTDCGWEASVTSGGAYVAINSGSSGSSSGAVGFDLSSNADGDRTAEITVLTTVVSPLGPIGSLIGVFDITQTECGGMPVGGGGAPPPPGESCSWEISPGSAGFDCTSQNGFFNVNTQLGCGWAASVISGGSFITIFSGSTGADAGTVQFSLSQNFGSARGGQIEVITTVISNLGPAGSIIGVFNIGQISFDDCSGGGGGAGAPCEWDASPKNWFSPDPCSVGTGTTQVTTSIGCSWDATVTSGGGFITITSGSSGLSSGTITFDVAANNTTAHRTGQITVTTAIASTLGPIGTPVAYINIDQNTCGSFFVTPDGTITQLWNAGCFALLVGSPPPVWDGTVHFVPGPNTWESGSFASYQGNDWGTGGGYPVSVGFVVLTDQVVFPRWKLQFTSSPTGRSAIYYKGAGTTPAGVYNLFDPPTSCVPPNPATILVTPI